MKVIRLTFSPNGIDKIIITDNNQNIKWDAIIIKWLL